MAVPLLALAAYLPSLSGAFLWNDSDYVTAPWLRGWVGLRHIWFRPGATQQYYPLLHSFFWAEYLLWGLHPLGYRLATLLLHASSCVLFGLVVQRLLSSRENAPAAGSPSIALAAAALFAVHPVNAESVAWITEQKNTLSLVFFLGAAWAYLAFDRSRAKSDYALALLLFLAALLSKTVVATLPADLLVVLWWKRGALRWRRDVRPLLPWLVLGAGFGLFASWVERHYVGAEGAGFDLGLAAKLLVAGRATAWYAEKLAWPTHLSFVYSRWAVDPALWWQWAYPAVVIGIGCLLWRLRRRTRAPFAAFLFFIGSLFPVLSFVRLYGARYSWTWDHWQYLPDLGPIVLFAGALWAGTRHRWPGRNWPFAAVIGGLVVGLGALTWSHCQMFRNDEQLYRDTLAQDPDSWMAHSNLGRILLDRGDDDEARNHLQAALRLNPAYPEAHNNLGIYLLKTGARAAGIAELRTALTYEPGLPEARQNLALALLEAPDSTDEGIRQLTAVVGDYPDDPQSARLHARLGNALAKIPGRSGEALAELRRAAQIDPHDAEIRGSLGIALYRKGDVAAATREFEAAVGIDPRNARSHNALGIALAASGSFARAAAEFNRALELDPNLAEARDNLGVVLERTGLPLR